MPNFLKFLFFYFFLTLRVTVHTQNNDTTRMIKIKFLILVGQTLRTKCNHVSS